MKQLVNFNLKEQSMAIESMESFRRSLKGVNRERFSLILDKINAGMKYYDSEEMIYISQSLHKYSKLLLLLKENPRIIRDFRTLANRVEKLRERHQARNHPIKRKEAQTAGTVHAS